MKFLKEITFSGQTTPSTPAAGYGSFYVNTGNKPFFIDDDGITYDLTASSGGTDVYVTGGTIINETILFTNNTGGTFTVTGLTSNSSAKILFLDSSGGTYSVSPINGDLLMTANTGTQTTIVSTDNGNTRLVATFLSDNTIFNSGIIPDGFWWLHLYASRNSGTVNFYFDISYIDSDGLSNKTLIASGSGDPVGITTNTEIMYGQSLYGNLITLPSNDKRLIIDIYVITGSGNRTTTLYFRDQTQSHIHTPLTIGVGDTYVTGGTYSNEVLTLTRNDNGNINVTGFTPDNAVIISANTITGSSVRRDNANTTNSPHSTISGGYGNTITSSNYSTIAGGSTNTISSASAYSTIGGGYSNLIDDSSISSIGGGCDNQLINNANFSSIITGDNNQIDNANYSIIGSGLLNTISDSIVSSILGGYQNIITTSSSYSSIIGGNGNTMTNSSYSTIIGGQGNSINLLSNVNIIGSSITAISANTTHINNLNIYDQPLQNDSLTELLVRDSDGMIRYRDASSIVSSGGTDVFVTGGTYSSGTTIFTNNSGGTFSVSGYSTTNIVQYTGLTLSNSGWTGSGPYSFTVTDANVVIGRIPEIIFNRATEDIAVVAGFYSQVDIGSGNYTVYARAVPSAPIEYTLNIYYV